MTVCIIDTGSCAALQLKFRQFNRSKQEKTTSELFKEVQRRIFGMSDETDSILRCYLAGVSPTPETIFLGWGGRHASSILQMDLNLFCVIKMIGFVLVGCCLWAAVCGLILLSASPTNIKHSYWPLVSKLLFDSMGIFCRKVLCCRASFGLSLQPFQFLCIC